MILHLVAARQIPDRHARIIDELIAKVARWRGLEGVIII